MRKISVVLVIILVISAIFTGCNKEADSQNEGDPPKAIKIGVFQPLSGANAAGGELEKMGIELAHEIFPTFNINGIEIEVEIKYEDNKSDKQESVNVAKRLVEDYGAHIVLGSWGSENAIAAGPVFQEAEIPAIGATCTNPLVTFGNEYYFRVCFLDTFQGEVMANYAFNEGKFKKVAIIQEITNDYSVTLVDIFQENFKNLTGDENAISILSNYNTGDTDFTSQLTAITNTDAEAIFFPGNFTESALIMKQARDLGITIPFLGGDTWEIPEVIEIGGEAAEGAVFSGFFNPSNPITEMSNTFLEAFAKEYGSDTLATGVTALGFDAYMLAKATIEKAGSLDGPTLRDTLAKTEEFEGATGYVTLDENGDAIKPAVIKIIENGEFVYKSFIEPVK